MELITKEAVKAELIFSPGGSDSIVDAIRDKAFQDYDPDTTTDKNRKKIASRANDVARSKTFLDTAGKALKSEWQKRVNDVDSERKRIRDTLDDLKIDIRRPLTDWEIHEAEKKRIEEEEKRKKIEEEAHKKLIEERNRQAKVQREEDERQKKVFEAQEKIRLKWEEENKKIAEEREKINIENARIAREKREIELEKERIEAEKRQIAREAELRKIAEENRVRAEKQRVIDEKKRIEEEALRENQREERDLQQRLYKEKLIDDIKVDIIDDLLGFGITATQSGKIADAIVTGKINHVYYRTGKE